MSSYKFTLAYRILDIARFAPSGDNVQPWEFLIISNDSFEIFLKDCSDWMIYDKLRTSSFLALGGLFEYIDIVAAEFGFLTEYSPLKQVGDTRWSTQVTLKPSKTVMKSKLFDTLTTRTVQRHSMNDTPLCREQIDALKNSVPDGFELHLYSTLNERKSLAKIIYDISYVRYAIKESYKTHKDAIDWKKGNERFSTDKIPPKALGLNAIMVLFTKLALSSWPLFHVLEKYFKCLVLPRFLMDYKSVVQSSAVFILTSDKNQKDINDMVDSGRAMVRLWLQTNHLSLSFQPQYTPVLFAHYLREEYVFTSNSDTVDFAAKTISNFKCVVGSDIVDRSVYMGRIGYSTPTNSRSTRKPMSKLVINDK